MNPVHDRPVVAIDFFGPLRRIAFAAAYHIQRLEAFSASLMFCFDPEPSNLFHRLLPFDKIWGYHDHRLLVSQLQYEVDFQIIISIAKPLFPF